MKRAPLDREALKAFSLKSNARSLRLLLLHVGLLVALGAGFVWLVNAGHSLIALPVLLAYGMVFSFLGYAGLGHELSHATVFTQRRVNDVLFWLVSFLTWNNPVYFRLSHRVHHRFTLQKGIDYEVDPRATNILNESWKSLLFDWASAIRVYKIFKTNAAGRVPGPFASQFAKPGSAEATQIVAAARAIIAGHGILAFLFIATGFYEGLLLFTLAAFVCTWPNRVVARLQHEGMESNANGLEESCRTVLLPGWLSFLYWNMNYHLEHHMYPAVPFHRLPALRQHLIRHLPGPTPSGISESLLILKH